jgi:hypothetical protein
VKIDKVISKYLNEESDPLRDEYDELKKRLSSAKPGSPTEELIRKKMSELRQQIVRRDQAQAKSKK